MNDIYQDAISSKLLSFSLEKTDYQKALKEWSFNGGVIDHGPIKDQMIKANCALCGHPIRYGYILQNKAAGRDIEVGSECIGNYEIAKPDIVNSALKRFKLKRYNEAMKAFKGAAWTIGNLRMFIKIQLDKHDYYSEINRQYRADYESCNTNNEAVVFHGLTAGKYQEIAQRYSFVLREDYLNGFLAAYRDAPKNKAGFFQRV